MRRKCKVVMLSTNKKEQITFVKHTQGKNVGKLQMPIAGGEYRRLLQYDFEPQHLYILSDEEIKEGDWMLNLIGNPNKNYTYELIKSKYNYAGKDNPWQEKIIATTNPELSTDDEITKGWTATLLPKISQDFIEAFIKAYNTGNPITEIMVEYEDIILSIIDNLGNNQCIYKKFEIDYLNTQSIKRWDGNYGHIENGEFIPAIHKDRTYTVIHPLKLRDDNTIIISRIKEKMYSREEVINSIRLYANYLSNTTDYPFLTEREWFNKNYTE